MMNASKAAINVLQLPAGLRNKIWEYGMQPRIPYRRNATDEWDKIWHQVTDRPVFTFLPWPIVPAICQVSQQTGADARKMFYGASVFHAYMSDEHASKRVQTWLVAIGKESAEKIRNLQLQFPRYGIRKDLIRMAKTDVACHGWIADEYIKVLGGDGCELVDHGWLDEVD